MTCYTIIVWSTIPFFEMRVKQMNSRQGNRQLDRSLPFQIDEVTLLGSENADHSFHWHNYHEITLVLRGEGCYYVNGRAHEVGPGDIVVFNSEEIHGWQIPQEEMAMLVLVFLPEFITMQTPFADLEYSQPFVVRGANFRNKIGRDELHADEIATLLKDIRAEWEQRKVGCQLMIKSDILHILTLLIRHYHDDSRAAGAPSEKRKAMRRLQAALDYIDEHYCERLTLRAAADVVFMSPNYFSHYFHSATGIRFCDYVAMRRILRARELLETTGKSIYEIAMECGFPNSSNFYRLYRMHTGESPRSRR